MAVCIEFFFSGGLYSPRFLRPQGHHQSRRSPGNFCLFNQKLHYITSNLKRKKQRKFSMASVLVIPSISFYQWMTAGRGIIHSEMPAGDGVQKGLQLWINLSSKDKMWPKTFISFSQSHYFFCSSLQIFWTETGLSLGIKNCKAKT